MEQGLQVLSKQERLAEWSERIMKCRNSGMTVRRWCQENGIAEKSYFYWQRRLFETLSRKQEAAVPTFAEVTPLRSVHSGKVAVTVRISGAEAEICNGARPQKSLCKRQSMTV